MADTAEVIEKIGKGFEEFKSAHAKQLEELKAGNTTRAAELEEQLKKINAALDKAEDERKKAQDEIEKKMNRLLVAPRDGAPDPAVAEQKASFFSYVRRGEKAMAETERKSLITGVDTQGGVLAPSEYVAEIIKGIVLVSPVRSLVRVRQTSQRSVQQPKRTGTSSATWVGEVQTRTESTNPAYGLVEIPTHEMTAEHYVSFAELEDAVFPIESELREEFAEQFAKAEGAAVIGGNGVGKPFGFLADSGVLSTNSGSAATIADANGQANGIIALFHALATDYAKSAIWCLNRTTLGSVRKLQDSQKRYLWEPGVANGMPPTILGAPYCECPDMPLEAANATPIAFGDFKRAYTLVDRVAISVVRDDYTKASVGQVKFVARRRVGGQVVLSEAMRLLKCAS
jgi:HK97 family phage major capsid protein